MASGDIVVDQENLDWKSNDFNLAECYIQQFNEQPEANVSMLKII